ncbi:MAG: hypothetical protein LUE17_10245 [Planctomycetaceae bacterium]|nr:hypothetical protein [Planctomycetaceae bacterium]
MGDVTETPMPPPRRGCLRWTCGCLVVVLLLAGGGGYLLYRHLSPWRPGESPWENLPSSTRWAVEVHDFKSLVRHAAEDPGFASFLNAATASLNTFFLSEDVEGHPEDVLSTSFAMFQNLGFFYRMLVPNGFLIGGSGPSLDRTFVILRPPFWVGYALGLTGEGTVQRLEDDEDDIYYARTDGWLILALDEAVVQSVLDGWGAAALPLGKRADRRGAYIALALRPDEPEPSPGDPAPGAGPGHFTLADPFSSVATPAAPAAMGIRLLLLPESIAWHFSGEAVPNGGWTNEALSSLGEQESDPLQLRTAAFDLAVSVRAAPEVAATVRERLRSRLAATVGDAPALLEWLDRGWLELVGDDATLLAAAPVVTNAPYPGLPVAALGWSVRETVAVRDAAQRFASTLDAWLEELRTASSEPLVRGAAAGITVTAEADGMRGRIAVPPVLVSGARPGWRFRDEGRGSGWFATDPSALDGLPAAAELPLADLAQTQAGQAEVAGAWVLGPEMIEGVRAWLWDRFEMSRAYGRLDDDGRKVTRLSADLTTHLVTAWPRGQVRLRYDEPTARCVFVGRIPHGGSMPGR